MALFSRIFQNRRVSRNSVGKGDSQEQNREWAAKELERSQIRLVLFRDHDLKGRSVLFDSTAVHRVEPQGGQNAARSKFYVPLSKGSKGAPEEGGESTEQVPGGTIPSSHHDFTPGADTKLLGEMMYGSVAMSYKGASFKVHSIRSPPQVMMTKLFRLHAHTRESTIEGESLDGYSIQSTTGDTDAPRPINTTSSPQIAHSVPMDVPSPPKRDVPDLETEDSSFSNSLTSSTSSLCTSLPSPSSSASNSFTSSLNSMHRRLWRSQTTSLEYNLMKRASDESGELQPPVPASKRPPNIGVGIIFNLPADETQAKQLQYFLFSHIMLLESHISKLCKNVEKAMCNRKAFLYNVHEAFDSFVDHIRDLYLTPRLSQPVWLTMTTGNTMHRIPMCQRFLKELMVCLDKYDTKSTKFFVSTLVTAVLTHHLAWVPTVTPAWAAPSRTYLDKHSAKWLDAIAKSHPYNPLWAQLSDLYGAIGFPTRLSRTVVIGRKNDIVNRMLYILSYFIRCSEVLENTDQQPVVVETEYLDDQEDTDSLRSAELCSKSNNDNLDSNPQAHKKPQSGQTMRSRSESLSSKSRSDSMTSGFSSMTSGSRSQWKSESTVFSQNFSTKNSETFAGGANSCDKDVASGRRTNSQETCSISSSHVNSNSHTSSDHCLSSCVCDTTSSHTVDCQTQVPSYVSANLHVIPSSFECLDCKAGYESDHFDLHPKFIKDKTANVMETSSDSTSTLTSLPELQCLKSQPSHLITESMADTQAGLCQLSPNNVIRNAKREMIRNVGRVATELELPLTSPDLTPNNASKYVFNYPSRSEGAVITVESSSSEQDEGLYSLVCEQNNITDETRERKGSTYSEVSTRSRDDLDSGIFETGYRNCATDSTVSCESNEISEEEEICESSHLKLDTDFSTIITDLTENTDLIMNTGSSTNPTTGDDNTQKNSEPKVPLRKKSALTRQIEVPFERCISMFDEYFQDTSADTPADIPDNGTSKVPDYTRQVSLESTNSMFDEYLSEPCPDVSNIEIDSKVHKDGSLEFSDSLHMFDEYFTEDGSTNPPDGVVRQQVEDAFSLMHRLQKDQQGTEETSKPKRPTSLNIDVNLALQHSNPFSRQSSMLSSGSSKGVTPVASERKRHLSAVSTTSSVETLDFFLHLKEVAMPKSDFAADDHYSIQEFERNFGHSLLAGHSSRYLSDFVLHGTRDTNFQARLHSDLTMAVQDPVLDEPIAEAACILADTDKWSVRLQTCQYSSPDRVHSKDLTASRYILDTMESIHNLWKLKMSPEFCLMHLEDKLQEVYFKSKVLAEYIRTHRKISLKELSVVLGIDVSDLPLMLAVAGTHSSLINIALLQS